MFLLSCIFSVYADDSGSSADIEVEAERPDDAPDPLRTPGTVTVLVVDERLSAGADVAEVLGSAAGVNVQRLGGLGDFSAVSIRGSALRHVQIYLDGVPLNPDGSDTINLSELPLASFSRVEVWRGYAPPVFAAAPIGGVVNLVTGDVPTAGSAAYGSHATGRMSGSTAVDGHLGATPTEMLVIADLFSTAGDFTYFADNATLYNVMDDRIEVRENNDKDQLSTHIRFRIGDDDLRLTLMDAFLARDEGLPGHTATPTTDTRLRTTRNLTVVEGEGRASAWSGKARVWYQARREIYDDRGGELGVGSQWRDDHSASLGVLGSGQWVPTSWVSPSLTLSVRQDRYVPYDLITDATEDPRRRLAVEGALAADLRFFSERLHLSPVAQLGWLDSRLLGTTPFSDLEFAPEGRDATLHFDPRIGVLARPWPTLSLKANAGHYVRPPDFTELFGDRGGIIGNSDLLPETGYQWDVGFRVQTPAQARFTASLDACHFWNATQNLITFVQNAQRIMSPVNIGKAWTQGVEAAVTLDAFGWADSQSSFTWTLSRNLLSNPAYANNQLPRVPAWDGYQSTSVHWDERLRVGHTFSYTAGNYWDATNFYLSPPRAIHGAFVRVQPGERFPSFELSVLNLTDRTIEVVPRNPLDPSDPSRVVQSVTDFVGYPLPGRTFLFTLRWTEETKKP